MNLETFKEKLDNKQVSFDDTMAIIEKLYHFSETAFSNNGLKNEAGQNSGSCKLFAFAQMQNLTEQQTLNCFGRYYHDDVMNHPNADNHQNIRNFIKAGWKGIQFDGIPLRKL